MGDIVNYMYMKEKKVNIMNGPAYHSVGWIEIGTDKANEVKQF
ncbi:hypothetical protein VSK92_02980 [Bacillus swezeyi]